MSFRTNILTAIPRAGGKSGWITGQASQKIIAVVPGRSDESLKPRWR